MSDDIIRKIQLVQLNILKETVKILNKHNIDYMLYYGSLIGAVRHGGFIPWDDDLDIMLTRDNFEKFKAVAKKELPEYLFYQDYSTDAQYPSYISKVRDSRTKLVEKGYKQININHGIWVDVFVTDYFDNSKLSRLKSFTARVLQRLILDRATVKTKWKKVLLKVFINPTICFKTVDSLLKSMDPKNKREYCLCDYKLYKSECFKKLCEIKFEDITVKIPKEYDYCLKSYYGDYMELPPEENRVPDHLDTTVEFGDALN